ncbi:hypothetical protein [Cardinium endosymbiont of Culicoides punctatus]|uniref:hypothetical protein n=1 Tax=Cardinium endosymbiont of Culicoides punctatus TaxID=2304601 RepID=UPI0010591783|nr:hypothetical protein [Cardinium endosymbiont of Culicoides punctatus]
MKSSYFLSVFYCIVSFSVGTCVRMCYRKTWSNYYLIYNGSSCTWPQNISFEEKVHLIAEKVGMWENPTALFHSKDFAVIYRYPKTYQKHVKRLLANSKVALVHKKIALYSMEQLDLDAYLSLAEDCYQLYCKSMIPDSLLQMALGYCLAGDHPMVKHYQDEHVVRFFNTIKKYNFSDEFQNNIEMIRTGAMWEHWQHNQVSTNFKWEKKPIPFVKTIMHIIDQSKYYKHYIDLEGYIDGA